MRSARFTLTRFLLVLLVLLGCGPAVGAPADGGMPPPDGGPPAPQELRIADRAIVEWLASDADAPWWIEERLAPEPLVAGDRALGPRAIVRAAPERTIVWQPPESDRLTDACRHRSGEWSAVGVDADRRVFLARGDAGGLRERILLDDPELPTDPRAWLDTRRDVPRVGALTEESPTIAADGEDVVIALSTEDFAVLAYRWTWREGAFVRGARTLASPARLVTPYLPIGGSYDDFDALVAPYVPRLAVDGGGRAYVAIFADRGRIERHNAVFGTDLDLLREQLYPRENTSDALVSRIDRDGSIAFTRVVGTIDVEDEIFGIVAGDDPRGTARVAVLGRSRRELGRDNTELHAMIAELDADGTVLGTTTFDGLGSAIAQTGAYDGRDLWIGGTEGWLQNPSGRSVFAPGTPFVARLRDAPGGRAVERADGALPATDPHAELRALRLDGARLWVAGHERGPLTHTGDHDRSLVRSDAYYAITPIP